MKTRVVSTHSRGPGNRIKSFLSARVLDPGAKVLWPVNQYCGARWSDLFKTNVEAFRLEPTDYELGTWRWIPPSGNDEVDFLYERTPPEVLQTYSRLLEYLVPSDEVQRRIDAGARVIDDATVTLSVRSWWEVSHRALPQGALDAVVKKIGDRKVFVTCDHPNAYHALFRLLGKRLVYAPRSTHWGDRQRVEGVQDALADMYLGGTAPEMYVTDGSTYCEVQWWIGGCQSKVHVFGHQQREVRKPRDWAKYLQRVRTWRDG